MEDTTHGSSAGAAVADMRETDAGRDSDTATKTILLLDSVKLFLNLERTLLQRRGWTIMTAESAAEAQRLMVSERIDLLIMDYVLPDMAGDAVVRWVKQNPTTAGTEILIVTARGMRDHIDRCMAAGCSAFLFKPVSRVLLGQKVQELLQVPVRRHVRTLVRLEVKASCRDKFMFGNTVNLSASGMLLESGLDLGMGESLNLRFFLPGSDQALVTDARVVRRDAPAGVKGATVGLVFENMSEEDRERVASYVDEAVPGAGSVGATA